MRRTHQPLPRELKDHPLKGNWKNYRDIPIEPDWILIYKIDDGNLWLVRTGTHVDLVGGYYLLSLLVPEHTERI